MRVLRGRRSTLSADREATRSLAERAGEGEPGLRVWQPPRHVAFGRRDANRDGYERARESATRHDYAVVERSVGGHAVAFTGSTVAFALAEPTADARTGIQGRYERVLADVAAALEELGVAAERGEPEGAFCPGSHSLSARGKVVGLAQRVRNDAAVTAGVVVVRDRREVVRVLDPVYEALGVAFEPEAVGSLARAGGESAPHVVVATLVERLADDSPTEFVDVNDAA